jgi:hypothetical protein
MGRSLHRRSADLSAEKWAHTTAGAKRLANAYLMLRDERLKRNVDVFGQPYGGWDMGQLFAVHCLATLWCHGHLAFVEFKLDSEPQRDLERAQNQRLLRSLPDGVTGWVDTSQRGRDSDGVLRWDSVLQADIVPEGDKDLVSVEPSTAPLEIGNTDASCTCFHLGQSGAVARWPYGHKTLTLVVTRPRYLIARWRMGWPREGGPDPVLDDLVEFLNRIAFGRLAGLHMARALGIDM